MSAAESEREEAARRYVEQLRAFYVHASIFGATTFLMFAANLLVNLSEGIAGEWSAWWSAWAFVGWGFGIAVHGAVVWFNRPSLGTPTWEQRQVERMLGR